MKKIKSFYLLTSFVLIASTAAADTIHLKNGSVLKGKVASFSDDQFVVVLDTGSSRFISRAMIFVGDVARIEFDSAPGTESAAITQREPPPSSENPTRDVTPSQAPSSSREPVPIAIQPTESNTSSPQGSGSGEVAREPEREPVKTPEPPPIESVTPARKPSGPVKTVNVDVAGKRDWTSTGLIVKRGDHIRIVANGSVTIDPASGQASGPEGTDLTDARKLMSDRPTGALIGVIGADNDDFIFVGRSTEFTATRDGLLFLSVNEGALSDNTGSYKTTIEVQSQGARKQQ